MRLIVIQEMLRSIETLTLAGQRHQIVKMVSLLEEEIVERAREDGDVRAEAVAVLLPRLRCEAERMVPDVRAFTDSAALLVDAIQETR